MGGYGSGTWTRSRKRGTLDALKRIEINYLKKLGALNPPQSGVLSWTKNGQPHGYINFKSYHSHIDLNFNFKSVNKNEWQPVEQRVFLSTTSCNFGGVRYWLICPNCKRRVGALCAADRLFLCRHCYDVGYDSQSENSFDRLNSKKDKLAKRIFEDYNKGRGRVKKKWMHQKTFAPLYQEYKRLEYRSMIKYEQMFTKLYHEFSGK
jgi:hypothetical protein